MFDDFLPRVAAEVLKLFWKSSARAQASDDQVVGKVVRVTDRIQPGRLGAVLIPVRGGTEEFYARSASETTIAVGQMVEVVAYAPPRTVEVERHPALTLTKSPTRDL